MIPESMHWQGRQNCTCEGEKSVSLFTLVRWSESGLPSGFDLSPVAWGHEDEKLLCAGQGREHILL